MRISPSLLDNISVCPCFEYKPYEKTGDSAADEGILLHKALETDEDGELNEEQLRTVEKTRELCKAIQTGWLAWDTAPVDKRIELHEQKLQSSFAYRGLMDRVYVNLAARRAFITDMKTGRLGLIRDAKDSFQLMAYSDMIFLRYPGLVDEIMVVLSSPRTNETSDHIYHYTEWESIKERIQKVIDSAEYPFKQPRFHEVLCPKCKWFSSCPQANKALVPVVEQTVSIPASILTKPVEELTETELAQNRAAADLFAAWSDLRKKAVDARVMQEGLELEGYTKVRKSGAPFIPADRAAEAWELLKSDLTPEMFIAACGRPSLNKLVEQLADDALGATLDERKEKAREHLFDVLEDVVQQSQSSEYLRRRAKLDLRLLGG